VPEVPKRRPGLFVVDLDGAMIDTITLDRRDAERPGHVRPDAGEAELGYMFLPEAWACRYAAEACAAALDWFAGALPSEPVVLYTQTANDRSMRLAAKLGFTEVERFEEYGAEQVRRVVLGHAVRLSSCSTAQRIHEATDRASDDASAVEQPGRRSPGLKSLACHSSAETMSGIAVEVIHRTYARAADNSWRRPRRRR